jgi:hypothetical protein
MTKSSYITNTAHNDLFIQMMSQKEKAIAFLRRFFPNNTIKKSLDFSPLSLVEGQHISRQDGRKPLQ